MNGPLTFEALLTPAGIVAAAAMVTTFVELLKRVFPYLDAKLSGALMAFVATTVLYIAAGIFLPQPSPNDLLNVVAAWLACATSSVGIHGTAKKAVEATTNT